MEHEGWAPASFHHPKNITVGNGRVLWAKASTGTNSIHQPEGWVLPGGVRTRDEEKAKAAAYAINAMSGVAA